MVPHEVVHVHSNLTSACNLQVPLPEDLSKAFYLVSVGFDGGLVSVVASFVDGSQDADEGPPHLDRGVVALELQGVLISLQLVQVSIFHHLHHVIH